MSSDYCPVSSLKEEVERFCKTNTFHPMEVTKFYLQARVVLRRLSGAETEIARLQSELREAKDTLEKVVFYLTDECCSDVEMALWCARKALGKDGVSEKLQTQLDNFLSDLEKTPLSNPENI